MKSLHDIRGEYRRARQRYGRLYNKWARIRPYAPGKLAAAAEQQRACDVYFRKEHKLANALGLDSTICRGLYPNFHEILMGRASI